MALSCYFRLSHVFSSLGQVLLKKFLSRFQVVYCEIGIGIACILVSMSHMTVTLVGDSFFKCLQQYLLQQQPDQSNFDFHSHMVAIAWMAESGLTLTKL